MVQAPDKVAEIPLSQELLKAGPEAVFLHRPN